ncbi:hypothetical protein KEM55_006880, partial [Ascosphaera atra]
MPFNLPSLRFLSSPPAQSEKDPAGMPQVLKSGNATVPLLQGGIGIGINVELPGISEWFDAMLKRGFGEDQTFSPAKRRRTQTSQISSRQEERWEGHEQEQEQEQPVDRLSNLSDELILHILSYLSTSSLLECQSVSHRFHTLANDSELWKAKYYTRFVWPRTRRIRRRTAGALTDHNLDAIPNEDAHPPTPSRPEQA